MSLEIIPVEGPAEWRSGAVLHFQVLDEGKPLANENVRATYVGFRPEDAGSHATSTHHDGMAAVRITQPGSWVLRVRTRQPASGAAREQDDYESGTPTLALEIHPGGTRRYPMRELLSTGGVTIVLLTLIGGPRPVLAHDLHAEVKLRGSQAEVEAFYDDNTPVGDARVTVLDTRKDTIVEGRTDAKGRWAFKAPSPGVYQVVVDAGDGHRVQVPITIPVANPSATGTGSPSPTSEGAADDPDARTISEGPTRAEATRFPWANVALGLIFIAGLSVFLWSVLRRTNASASHSGTPGETGPVGQG